MHLGSPASQTEALLSFLESMKCDNLYIVGDFVDFFHLYEHHGWSNTCNKVVKRLLAKVGKNTRVRLCVGNHDAFLGILKDFSFGNVEIGYEFVHENKFTDYLVVHGDRFDTGMRFFSLSKVLCFISLHLHWFPFMPAMKRLADFVSHRNLNWKRLRRHMNEVGAGGCIMGHTHQAGHDKERSIWNCGDWVGSNTAVIESDDHEMSLFKHTP